jgi:hypothetical protein
MTPSVSYGAIEAALQLYPVHGLDLLPARVDRLGRGFL